jgi:DNA-binding transcriptional regulator YhcF (GntR family)
MQQKNREFVLPEIALDRHSRLALHRQLRRQLEPALRLAAPGSRLPSTRVMAKLLGVSRNTVMNAYEELAADGLVHGKPGAAVFVADTKHARPVLDPRQLLREAQFPSRTLRFTDPDGTPLNINY